MGVCPRCPSLWILSLQGALAEGLGGLPPLSGALLSHQVKRGAWLSPETAGQLIPRRSPESQAGLCCATLGKSWLLWPPCPRLQSPHQLIPERPRPCPPRQCPLAGGVWFGAPLPFSSGLWAGGKCCLLSQQLLSPLAPARRRAGPSPGLPAPRCPQRWTGEHLRGGTAHTRFLKQDLEGFGEIKAG